MYYAVLRVGNNKNGLVSVVEIRVVVRALNGNSAVTQQLYAQALIAT